MNESISELRRRCHGSAYEGWASQPWVFLQYRKISIYLTWVLLHARLTPNQISVLALICGVLSSFAIASKQLMIGVTLVQLTILLDFSDGEVSRYRNQKSKEGSYLDKIYIFFVYPILFAGLVLYQHQLNNSFILLVAGFINVISVFMYPIVTEYAKQLAVWRHFIKSIFTLDEQGNYLIAHKERPCNQESIVQTLAEPRNEIMLKVKYLCKKLRITQALRLWDFPYVFLVMSVALILEDLNIKYLIIERTSVSQLFIYFYALTYPLITVLILTKNLLLREIEEDYKKLMSQYMKRFDAKA